MLNMPHPENPKGETLQSPMEMQDAPAKTELSKGAQAEFEKVGPIYLATHIALQNLKTEIAA